MTEGRAEQSPKDRLLAMRQERTASTTAAGHRIKNLKDQLPSNYHTSINQIIIDAMGVGRDDTTIQIAAAMIDLGLDPSIIVTVLDRAETKRRKRDQRE